MSFLEKVTGKKNEVAPISKDRRVMDEALAKVRRVNAPTNPRLEESRAPNPSEIVEVRRICAVHDKPYLAIYERRADGLYAFSTSVRVEPELGGTAGRGDSVILNSDNLATDRPAEFCAWCHTGAKIINGGRTSSIKCGGCGSFICLGRLDEKSFYFQCRHSCGCAGVVGDKWANSEGARRAAANPQPAGSPVRSGQHLLLSPATTVPAKREK